MTHILIPIEQWQTFLKAREREDIDYKTVNGYLERVINEVKEISLSEEQIEKSAFESAQKEYKTKIGGDYLHFIKGFVKALKSIK